MINLQELEKLESEVHESNEAANRLEKEKVRRVMSCRIAAPGERNVIFWGLEFEEIKEKRPDLVDEQIFKSESKIIRPRKFLVLGHSGDLEKIKEIIKEFFKKGSKTKNIFRINKADVSNEKTINEIKEFVEQESRKIDFPDAKIKLRTCNLEGEANDKSKYADRRSERYHELRNLFRTKQIELNLPRLKEEIKGQFSKINWKKAEDGRKQAVVPEENQELIEALIYFVYQGGLAFDFVKIY